MRSYKIIITDSNTGKVFRTYGSTMDDGTTDTGALNVELDAPVTTFADPMGDTGAAIRVWGIPLQDIEASADFNGKLLQFYGGMAKGLPLANPAQAGLLFQGQIFQCWGNWVGVNMELNFIVIAYTGTSSIPANIVLNWKTGQSLGDAIANALSTAFPKIAQNKPFNLNSGLTLGYDVIHACQTVSQLARFVKKLSADVVNGPANSMTNDGVNGFVPPNYTGVNILLGNAAFTVYDGTSVSSPKAISFLDLIGQPTWLNPFQMQFITVMRHDVVVGDYVALPPGPVTVRPQSLALFKDRPTFQGTFQVDGIRHAGNFRQNDAAGWVTVFDAHKVAQSQTTPVFGG